VLHSEFRCPSTQTWGELEGGEFLQPDRRAPAPALVRSIVLGPLALGEIRSASVDPEGRFLLVHRRSPTGVSVLTRVPLTQGLAHRDVLTSSQAPLLDRGDYGMAVGNFAAQGRIAIVVFQSNVVYLRDPDNDGAYDAWGVLHDSAYVASFPRFSWTHRW
jgi:hypothetical protein